MRSGFFMTLAVCAVLDVQAQPLPSVQIERLDFGSGEPERPGFENATAVNDVYHAPQYLPGLPTSASIWPRVVEVPCTRAPDGALQCKGYQWLPTYGRAEYLYFRPVIAGTPVSAAPDDLPLALVPSKAMGGPATPKPVKAAAVIRKKDR